MQKNFPTRYEEALMTAKCERVQMMRKFVPLLAAVMGLGIADAAFARARAQDADRLAAIVQKAFDYCRRLDRAALSLMCKEEVEEESLLTLSPPGTRVAISILPLMGGRQFLPVREDDTPKTVSLYDDRLVKNGDDIKENRGLLEKNETPTADTSQNWHFRFRDILFGPSLLFGEGPALKYEYSLVGEGKIQGDQVLVVACTARPEYAAKLLWGRASIRLKDGAVLRIDWAPESLASHDEALDIAKRYQLTPKIQAYTEFGAERHGVRFPSLDFNEEAYVTREKVTFVRSRTAAKYKAYVFYTVETEGDIKRP
jgi:hypothetical protein